MLIQCPECSEKVSDKALACPHCGLPFAIGFTKNPTRGKSRKRMRLPNGFGQISEIKGKKLRKPFRAMVSIGKKPNGRPIVVPLKPVAYFATYNEAYSALLEYNKNPFDLNAAITVEELYNLWLPEYSESVESKSPVNGIKMAWAYCSDLYRMNIKDVKSRDIKYVIDNGYRMHDGEKKTASAHVQTRIKTLFNLMFDYAVEYEYLDKNPARNFTLSANVTKETTTAKKPHIDYTEDEMKALWQNITDPDVELVVFQCYSGWRPSEIGLLKLEDVDLAEGVIRGGIKTEAGTNRIVPIHSKVRGIVERRYAEAKQINSEYLFNYRGGPNSESGTVIDYGRYLKILKRVIKRLNLNKEHRPHDGRVQFITSAKRASVDEYAIKYMVGHVISDLTERVYTKRSIDWLKTEIEKIK